MDDRRRQYASPFPLSSPMSPYLDIDRSIFKTEPQYIMPEGASQHRGRFEMAFSQIGGCVIAGAGIGGMQGLYRSLKAQPVLSDGGGLLQAARRAHLLNAFTKYGSSAAGALGVLAVMYAGFGALIGYARGAEDELNTLSAGALTGALYRSVAGWKKCAYGGLAGFAVAGLYCLVMKQEGVERATSKLMPWRW